MTHNHPGFRHLELGLALTVIRLNGSRFAIAVICMGVAATAGRTCAAQNDDSATERVQVRTITGELIESPIESISDGFLHGPAIPSGMRVDQLMSIATPRKVIFQKPQVAVYLAAGGVLYGHSVTYQDEQFSIASTLGKLTLSAESVSGILFQVGTEQSVFEQALQRRLPAQDRVIATTPDGRQTVAGLLESITADKVYLNFQGKSRAVSLSKMYGIVSADLPTPAIDGVIGSVQLVDGSTIVGGIQGLRQGTLQLALPGEQPVRLNWSEVKMIAINSSKVVYLSDLEPILAEQYPTATHYIRPWQRDSSIEKNPLRLRDSDGKVVSFRKGIGTHHACRLEFANDRQFNRFAATVGIDVETAGHGDCLASVWADGIELWSARITGKTEAVSVDVDITGMRVVVLVVREGEHHDMGDHVAWADARFIRTD